MAGQGTHIRFAVDLIEKLAPVDIKKYLSGTVYPDSRYLTKINRDLTHPKGFLEDKSFFADDFKKGWYLHLLCDQLQINVIKDEFPQLFVDGNEAVYGNDLWVSLTAIKFIQDMEDMKCFPIGAYLQYLDCVQNPNGEDISILKKYYRLVHNMYIDSLGTLLEPKYQFFLKVSSDPKVVDKCRRQVNLYLKDAEMISTISGVLRKMIERVSF